MAAKKEKVKYTNPWGILGHPTPEQIQTYMNMPYGEFKALVGRLIKIKKTIAEYDVEVIRSDTKNLRRMNSLERIWARATGHLMGQTDKDRPDVPILSIREARIALLLKTFWVIIHIITCGFIIVNVIRHW